MCGRTISRCVDWVKTCSCTVIVVLHYIVLHHNTEFEKLVFLRDSTLQQFNHSPDWANFVNHGLASCYPTTLQFTLPTLERLHCIVSEIWNTFNLTAGLNFVLNVSKMLIRKSGDEQFKVLPHWQYCALFGDFSTSCISTPVCMCCKLLHSTITTIQTGFDGYTWRNSLHFEHVFSTHWLLSASS